MTRLGSLFRTWSLFSAVPSLAFEQSERIAFRLSLDGHDTAAGQDIAGAARGAAAASTASHMRGGIKRSTSSQMASRIAKTPVALPDVEFYDPMTEEWSTEPPVDGMRSLSQAPQSDIRSLNSGEVNQSQADKAGSCESDTSTVTYIMSTSYRICPSLALFDMVLKSHFEHMRGFAEMRKLVVFDGFGDLGMRTREEMDAALENDHNGTELRKYEHHKEAVKQFLLSSPLYKDVAVMALPRWGGLLRGVHIALEKAVRTPYVYITQDDTDVLPTVDARAIVASMDGDAHIKYVRLGLNNRGPREPPVRGAPSLQKHCADLYSDNFFQDKNHFSRRDWYLDHVVAPVDPDSSDYETLAKYKEQKEYHHFWMDMSNPKQRLLQNGTTGGYVYRLAGIADGFSTKSIRALDARDQKWCKEDLHSRR